MTHPSQPNAKFYELTLEQRRLIVAERLGLSIDEVTDTLALGGLDSATADKIVENVLGTYALPFGIAPNFLVNGRNRWVPMVVEEPSVIAAASNAAKRIGASGGFFAKTLEDLMTVQIEVHGVTDVALAKQRLLAQAEPLLDLARARVPNLIARGGGPREFEVRCLGQGFLVVHLHVDCMDAMGANLVNTIAEGIGPRVAELAQGALGLRILTNLCDRRRVFVECHVEPLGLVSQRGATTSTPAHDLLAEAQRVAEGIEQASRFAELDPYRAATHNKGIMNGIDSVVIATGNDYRAVEAGAHAFAARSGSYQPLATWRRQGSELYGSIELPLALGIVGGTVRVHPAARLALKLLDVSSARELSQIVAAAGLASNFSALRALATDGIQQGHMALHARGIATLAGARGAEVERVAEKLVAAKAFNIETAQAVLCCLREDGVNT